MTEPDERERRVFELHNGGEWQRVVDVVDEVPDADRSASLNWCRGWALHQLGQAELAAACMRRAVLQKPRSAVFHWGLGVILRDRGDFDAAAEHLVLALSLRDSLPARRALAEVYLEQGRVDAAEQVHVEGLRLKPSDPHRLEAYAVFLHAFGREDEAAAQRRKAFTEPPSSEDAG